MVGLVEVFFLDPDLQGNVAAAHGGEAVLDLLQVTGHQCKQVGGFGMRIVPGHEVATIRQLTPLHRVAVGQQHRLTGQVADHGGREGRHHVRAVRVEGDATEPFRFALGAEHATGTVEPG